MLLALLFAATVLLAFSNGANDNFKATATLYGSGTLPYRRALILATGAQIAGSLGSILVARALLHAFGGKGLVPDAVVADPAFLVAVASGAASAVLVATRFGIPVSTTHALIGGLVGAGVALAPQHVSWNALGSRYFAPLLTSPLLAFAAAAVLYPISSRARQAMGLHETTCLCVGATLEPVSSNLDGALVLERTGVALTIAEQQSCAPRYVGSLLGVSAQQLVDALHGISAFALGFARGLNDTPKVLALLLVAGWIGLDTHLALALTAGAMAVGGWLGSRRLAETLGHRITDMNAGQGLVANMVASTLVIGASLLGSPVSTTHVSTGAIFGIGLWSGRASRKLAAGIVLAWVATLPVGAACAYLIATGLHTT